MTIGRKLLHGAEPVCINCRQPIPADAPKVAVCLTPDSPITYWRCADCEYKAQRA